ncbi:MAG: NAD(P)H-dependent oxidoreductase [Deltaproteobacteria bacterium]
MKKILIFNGHPNKDGFCNDIAIRYRNGALSTGAQCEIINIIDLNFDPVLKFGYGKETELEPDLVTVQLKIKEADHLVFVYPNWWATFPALLKGFIDRVFLPGFAFKYRENSPMWDKLLKGKSARMIVTMDSPKWYYYLFLHNAGHNAMKKGILEFCGISPVRISSFNQMRTAGEQKRQKWLAEVEELGARQI